MKYARLLKYTGISLLLLVVLTGHVIGLRRLLPHMAWPIVVCIIILLILKHVGVLGSIYASFKRRSEH